jgi:hypothetical protein
MAKYYFRLLLLIAAIVGIFWVIGALLPRSYSFTSEIEIAGSPDQIFTEINSLKNWQNWSRQWNPEKIEGLEIAYNGIPEGTGAAQTWTDIRGKGKLWITESEKDKRVVYEMVFANFPKMTSQMELVQLNKVTHLKWSSQGVLPGGPFYGFFGGIFSKQMKNEYELSMEKLKQIIEMKADESRLADSASGESDSSESSGE